jgi:hypothetical protein
LIAPPAVSVASADNRDIVDSVDGDAPVIRDRIGQRPDILALIVDDVHASSSYVICVTPTA